MTTIAGRMPLPTNRLLQRLQSIEQTLQGKGNLGMVVDLLRARESDLGRHRLGARHLRQSAW